MMLGHEALQRVLTQYEFDTVLDIGCGQGLHAIEFARAGKTVTAIDIGRSIYARALVPGVQVRSGRFQRMQFDRTFDCVWACHVLEHQLDSHLFLLCVRAVTHEGSVVAITVPPAKHEIVGGHVSLWNAGLLLYRLVLAGFDCSEARIGCYGYNVSVIVRRRAISLPLDLEYDAGDIRRLRQWLPGGLAYNPNSIDDPFDGEIERLNW